MSGKCKENLFRENCVLLTFGAPSAFCSIVVALYTWCICIAMANCNMGRKSQGIVREFQFFSQCLSREWSPCTCWQLCMCVHLQGNKSK